MFISVGQGDLTVALAALTEQIAQLQEVIVATGKSVEQVRADYKAFAAEALAQRDAALQLAEAKSAEAKQLADDLAAFVADDAATDATQLAEQAQEIADGFQSDLDELKGQPDPVEPTPSPEPPVEEPPVEEAP